MDVVKTKFCEKKDFYRCFLLELFYKLVLETDKTMFGNEYFCINTLASFMLELD